MRHLASSFVFVSIGLLRGLRTLLVRALALIGLASIALTALEPVPVRREVERRLRLLQRHLAVDTGPPASVEGCPPIRWPVPTTRVSSGFGSRVHPITGLGQVHRGVDLPVPTGTEVRSARPGRVTRVKTDPISGLHVVVEEHDHGLRFAYAHLSAVDVELGQVVQAGDLLGRSGNTGRSTGPHLHFGAWVHGRAVDPRRLQVVGGIASR